MIWTMILLSWFVWLGLGTVLNWLMHGEKGFCFTITFLAVAMLWVIWCAFPTSITFY